MYHMDPRTLQHCSLPLSLNWFPFMWLWKRTCSTTYVSRKRKIIHCPESESEPTSENGDRAGLGLTRNFDLFKYGSRMKSSPPLNGLLELLLECRDPVRSPAKLHPVQVNGTI
ncbi:hypothetical protein V6N13_089826 [Hibiscus sabdariffa]